MSDEQPHQLESGRIIYNMPVIVVVVGLTCSIRVVAVFQRASRSPGGLFYETFTHYKVLLVT